MSAVSCQVSAWILEELEHADPPLQLLIRNLPVGLEQLRDPTRHIDWDVFATLCERLEALLGGRPALEVAARQVAAQRLAAGETNAAARLTDPRQAYWLATRWVGPSLFSHLSWSLSDLPDGRLELRVETPPSQRPCPQLFVLLEAALAALPRLLHQPLARVDLDAGERRGVFTICCEAGPERAEAELSPDAWRLSWERYEAIAQSSGDVILEISSDGEVLFATSNVREVLGYDAQELTRTLPARLLHPDDHPDLFERIGKVLQTGDPGQMSYRIRHPEGGWRHIETTASALRSSAGEVRAVLVSRDVSDRKEVEAALLHSQQQLHHAQKMEAIGRLAGGVAHDFNNLLTVITGYADSLLQGLGAEHPLRDEVEQILRAAERGGGLTRQLLAFGSRQILQPQLVDLNALVADIDRLLRRLIGAQVEIVTSLDAELWPVKVDRSQLEQLIVNLAVNARDAMPRGGRLSVATGTARVPRNAGPWHPGVAPGEWVTLAVQDTGVGMEAATVDRIFEPFFTTKASGEGTGLGLATVYGIVQQSGGEIRVESRSGQGSTFTVYLPRADET
jgi:PAS domain S-box-containing protein